MTYILNIFRTVIILVFLMSSVGKCRDFFSFTRTIQRFNFLPQKMIRYVAVSVIVSEMIVVTLLFISGSYLIWGFTGALILLIIFSLTLALVLYRRISTGCNCFGFTDKAVSWDDVWRNAGFSICAISGLVVSLFQNAQVTALNWIDLGFVLVVSVIYVFVCFQIGDILKLFRSI